MAVKTLMTMKHSHNDNTNELELLERNHLSLLPLLSMIVV
jgi:hypothetical protein